MFQAYRYIIDKSLNLFVLFMYEINQGVYVDKIRLKQFHVKHALIYFGHKSILKVY